MGLFDFLDVKVTVLALAITTVAWAATLAIYRVYFDPLSKFPGDKLAALTGFYETYYDCVQGGRYWVEIQRMHEQYGPIVRISPWELHVNDPDFNEPYKISARASKYHWYYRFVGSSDAAFGTAEHELHRVRRNAQQSYFTAAHVDAFEPQLDALIEKLMSRLGEFKASGQPANLSDAYRCLAADVVQAFAFHMSYDLLGSPDFSANFNKTFRNFPKIGIWNRHFGVILDLLQALPPWLVAMLDPEGVDVAKNFEIIEERTKAIVQSWDGKTSKSEESQQREGSNIIHQMLDSPELSTQDKSPARLALEMTTLVGAGTETTGNTLQTITFYLLKTPEKADRLRKELTAANQASQRKLKSAELQQLPYLCAVVSEGHRISSSVAGRLPRINKRDEIRYKDHVIPAGTVVSTTQKLFHDNAQIFPHPREFLPERWLEASERKRLEKYLQPFGRGSRNCLGMHLANSEVYMTLARLFAGPEMQLFETTEREVEQYNDYFSPFPQSLKGVRVLFTQGILET